MLAGSLPALVDHRKMANQAGELKGSLPVTAFPRFAALLATNTGEVQLSIRFDRDAAYRVSVRGHVDVTGTMVCQSCLKQYNEDMHGELDFLILAKESEIEELEDDQDSIIYSDEKIAVTQLVEDDLILAVPMIPRHPGECPDSDYAVPDENRGVAENNDSTTHRPFAGLAEAMKKQNELES